jgi:hypothetical protein
MVGAVLRSKPDHGIPSGGMCDVERSCIFPAGRPCPDHDAPDTGPYSFPELFERYAPDDDAGDTAADTAA